MHLFDVYVVLRIQRTVLRCHRKKMKNRRDPMEVQVHLSRRKEDQMRRKMEQRILERVSVEDRLLVPDRDRDRDPGPGRGIKKGGIQMV